MTGPAATLALSIGFGAGVSLLCQRARVPALLPLMGVGVLVGPSVLGVVDAASISGAMRGLVAVVVGLLVFEGALHLDRDSITQAPRATRGLLTIGALVTWVGAALLAWWLLGLPPGVAALLGAILIVTGPTVVVPLLRRVRLTRSVHSALLAEGILIDPIGVIATVVTLEIVSTGRELALAAAPSEIGAYAMPFAAGLVVALPMALLALWICRRPAWRGRAGDEGVVTVCLAACLIAAGLAELIRHEAGLVATAVLGLVMARGLGKRGAAVRHAMENIAAPLVGTLFVLLASRFDVSRLGEVGWREWVFVFAVMFAVRPLGVALSTWGSALTWRERAYVGLIGPRGIVAVSSAALVAETLAASGGGALGEGAARVELIVLLVVVVTVAWSATLAGPLAGLLRVRAPAESSVMLVGIHRLSTELATQLAARGVPVLLVDANAERVRLAGQQGLRALHVDATDEDQLEQRALDSSLACVLALTGNEAVDDAATRWGAAALPRGQSGAWIREHRADLARLAGLSDDDPRSMFPLGPVLQALAIGDLVVSAASEPPTGGIPLIWVSQGRATLQPPGKPGAEMVCLGLGARQDVGLEAASHRPS